MGKFTNANELAKKQRKKADQALKSLKIGHQKLAEDCYLEARKITSGRTSTKSLKAMGHPYGRRSSSYSDIKSRKTILGRQRTAKGSRMRMPGLPINKQTGRLQNSIKVDRRGGNGKSIQTYTLRIINSIAPYAKYVLSLGGTVKMVARPFWQHLFKFWKRKNFELLLKMREEQRKS